jgi:phage terminase small subunit
MSFKFTHPFPVTKYQFLSILAFCDSYGIYMQFVNKVMNDLDRLYVN